MATVSHLELIFGNSGPPIVFLPTTVTVLPTGSCGSNFVLIEFLSYCHSKIRKLGLACLFIIPEFRFLGVTTLKHSQSLSRSQKALSCAKQSYMSQLALKPVQSFLQGISIACCLSVCLSVCPSVRPSVTRCHLSKRRKLGSGNLHRRIAAYELHDCSQRLAAAARSRALPSSVTTNDIIFTYLETLRLPPSLSSICNVRFLQERMGVPNLIFATGASCRVLYRTKTVVICKIKHLQKCFKAVDFPRLCRGRTNVVKMFYFTCNHLLSSTCVQRAKTFAKTFYHHHDHHLFETQKYITCNHL